MQPVGLLPHQVYPLAYTFVILLSFEFMLMPTNFKPKCSWEVTLLRLSYTKCKLKQTKGKQLKHNYTGAYSVASGPNALRLNVPKLVSL